MSSRNKANFFLLPKILNLVSRKRFYFRNIFLNQSIYSDFSPHTEKKPNSSSSYHPILIKKKILNCLKKAICFRRKKL